MGRVDRGGQQARKPESQRTPGFTECAQSFTERRFYWRFAQVIVDFDRVLRVRIGWLRTQRDRAGPAGRLQWRTRPCCLPPKERYRHPD